MPIPAKQFKNNKNLTLKTCPIVYTASKINLRFLRKMAVERKSSYF
jgi:hypothetical protein